MAAVMIDFIDVPGASGTRYRFRRTAVDELPATAGNLVVAGGASRRLKVLFCASARSLAKAGPAVSDVLKAHRGAKLFVRLNVGRIVREAEHADIVAAAGPETVSAELD
jgi:hypothetical protein